MLNGQHVTVRVKCCVDAFTKTMTLFVHVAVRTLIRVISNIVIS
jgi:hypothetical protein